VKDETGCIAEDESNLIDTKRKSGRDPRRARSAPRSHESLNPNQEGSAGSACISRLILLTVYEREANGR